MRAHRHEGETPVAAEDRDKLVGRQASQHLVALQGSQRLATATGRAGTDICPWEITSWPAPDPGRYYDAYVMSLSTPSSSCSLGPEMGPRSPVAWLPGNDSTTLDLEQLHPSATC